MIEHLWNYGGESLALAATVWIGVAAFFLGLKRFGRDIKVPLWLLFVVLWGIITLMVFVGGRTANIILPVTILPIFVFGILVYLASLLVKKNPINTEPERQAEPAHNSAESQPKANPDLLSPLRRPSMIKLIGKFKTKQFGVFLIIVGAFIPSILYPFTSTTPYAQLAIVVFAQRGASYDTSIKDLEIVLMEGERKKDSKKGSGYYSEGRLALPYKYTMAFGILLSFIGIGFVAFYKNKRESD